MTKSELNSIYAEAISSNSDYPSNAIDEKSYRDYMAFVYGVKTMYEYVLERIESEVQE